MADEEIKSSQDMDAEEEPQPPQPFPHPLAGKGEDITSDQDGGVLKAIRKEGIADEGPMQGDTVYVHYVGTLLDGSQFDSSRDRGDKFSFKLGKGEVIKAWDIAVATMKRGEISVITCTPEYAYGKRQQNKIPTNSTLVFEVELFDWTGEDVSEEKDGSIIKRVLKSGEGTDTASEDSAVEVHLVGRHKERIFDERDVTFIIGECGDHNVIEGVEVAIQNMLKGESCRLVVKPKYAFGPKGSKEFNIPPDCPVEYDVTLISLEKAKESWEMDSDEKLAAAEIAKAKGTAYFKSGRYQDALKHYKKVINFVEFDTDFSEEQKAMSKPLLLASHLNCAMSHIKIDDNVSAVDCCNRALEMDETNEKGLFRRGQARAAMKDWELAKTDFAKVVENDPNNKAAKNQVSVCAHHIKQHREREKRMYNNMFSKFAAQDYKPDPPAPEPFSDTIDHFGDKKPSETVGDEEAPQTTANPDNVENGTASPSNEQQGGGDATQTIETPQASTEPMES